MTDVKGRDTNEMFGEAKKEAFHLKAEEGVTSFAFGAASMTRRMLPV